MNEDQYTVVELHSIRDDLIVPWLALYETAFPPSERCLVADVLDLLKRKAEGMAGGHHLLALANGEGRLDGIAWYQLDRQVQVAILGYLAIAPEARGRGHGTWFYREIRRRVDPVARALLLEVEIPEQAGSGAAKQAAERRIEFYRRLGARLLAGVSYLQSVGRHQAPIAMDVMVHPLRPITAGEAFRLASAIWGERIQQVNALRLV